MGGSGFRGTRSIGERKQEPKKTTAETQIGSPLDRLLCELNRAASQSHAGARVQLGVGRLVPTYCPASISPFTGR
jgi:hypothetical protein